MDLTQAIELQNFLFNDPNVEANIVAGAGNGTGLYGSVVDSVDMSATDVVQFQEKRSQQDGMDAGDVHLGARHIRMAGTLYALSRNLLYDAIATMQAIMSPVLAQRSSPLDYGYIPLYYSVPTNNISAYPSGAIPLMVYVLPRAFQVVYARRATGGDDSDQLAVPWQATFTCKDPGIYGSVAQDYPAIASGNVSDNVVNRGTYICPLNMLIVVGTAAGHIDVNIGGSAFTITVPASTNNRTIRFKGQEKILTLEENTVENLRYDLINFSNSTTWPLIDIGTTAYNVTFTGVTPQAGSHLWFNEQYA